MYTINLDLLSVNCVFVVFFSKQANCCLDNHLLGKQANCLSPFREGTEKVPVFEKTCFIQLSISGCRELRQTDSNK